VWSIYKKSRSKCSRPWDSSYRMQTSS
jgi:hypothetical protein